MLQRQICTQRRSNMWNSCGSIYLRIAHRPTYISITLSPSLTAHSVVSTPGSQHIHSFFLWALQFGFGLAFRLFVLPIECAPVRHTHQTHIKHKTENKMLKRLKVLGGLRNGFMKKREKNRQPRQWRENSRATQQQLERIRRGPNTEKRHLKYPEERIILKQLWILCWVINAQTKMCTTKWPAE